MKLKSIFIVLLVLTFLTCKDKPKLVPLDPTEVSKQSHGGDLNAPNQGEFHAVIINEILPTSNYIYFKVIEGSKSYWIAANKMDAKVGETYYYKDGLLMTDFKSKETNRVFDELIMVNRLLSDKKELFEPDFHGSNMSGDQHVIVKEETLVDIDKVVQHEGSIKIAELVNNSMKYEGKAIQLDGVCTKVNLEIMDRNWIHIKDGSKDDFDLVVTSTEKVSVGDVLTIKATVVLNKNFGAGYKYDIILENGEFVKNN